MAALALPASSVLRRRRPLLAPALVLVVVLVDVLVALHRPSLLVHGVLDEIGHLATTGVLLAAGLRLLPSHLRPRTTLLVATLASSVLIDIDHVPAVLGWEGLTAGTARPYPHSFATLVLLGVSAALLAGRARPWLVAVLAGVTAHLLRDLGTAPVALWWPVSVADQQIPYLSYLALLTVIAAVDAATVGRRRPLVIDVRDGVLARTDSGLGQPRRRDEQLQAPAPLGRRELSLERVEEAARRR